LQVESTAIESSCVYAVGGRRFLPPCSAPLCWNDELLAQETREAAPLRTQRIEPGDTILLQGDSITDAGRKRDLGAEANSFDAMGNGYAWQAAAQL
jgi:hypothetical protein